MYHQFWPLVPVKHPKGADQWLWKLYNMTFWHLNETCFYKKTYWLSCRNRITWLECNWVFWLLLNNTHWDLGDQKPFHNNFLSGFIILNGESSIFEVEMVLSYMPTSEGNVGSQGKPVSSYYIACSGTSSRCLNITWKTAIKVVYITYYLIK